MKLLSILMMMLFTSVAGQAPLAPTRLELMPVGADAVDVELDKLVRGRLRASAAVVFGTSRLDFSAFVTASKIDEGAGCKGFVAAMLVVGRDGKPRLSLHTGESLEALAAHLTEKLQTEFRRKR